MGEGRTRVQGAGGEGRAQVQGAGRTIAVVGHGSRGVVEVAARTTASRGLLSVVAIEARSWCKHVPLVMRTDVPLAARTGRWSACGLLISLVELCIMLRLASRRYPSLASALSRGSRQNWGYFCRFFEIHVLGRFGRAFPRERLARSGPHVLGRFGLAFRRERLAPMFWVALG